MSCGIYHRALHGVTPFFLVKFGIAANGASSDDDEMSENDADVSDSEDDATSADE